MQINRLTLDNLPALYAFWQEIGTDVPFFYPVDFDTWRSCLLEFNQSFDGLQLTPQTEQLLVAFEGDQVIGFIQFGKPTFGWDRNGKRVDSPDSGVIRHFYFDREHPAAGEALLQMAVHNLAQAGELHAFFQAHGMSCNAWHGKLHPAHSYIEDVLLRHGFAVDQENPFYTAELSSLVQGLGQDLTVTLTEDKMTSQHFAAWHDGKQVGTAIMHPMDKLTGRLTRDVVYMRWIGINKELRGKGLGSQFMGQLAQHYLTQGYSTLHLDTASTNLGAQRFYERHGFGYLGSTRSYVRR